MIWDVKCYPAGWDNTQGNYSYKTNSLYNYLEAGGYLVEGETNSAENIPNLTTSDKRYHTWQVNTNANTTSYVYVLFDFSGIPEDAIIESVSCKTYASTYSFTGDITWTGTIQVYSGDTPKSESQNLNFHSGTEFDYNNSQTFSNMNFTRAELNDFRIKLSAVTTSSLSVFSANLLEYVGGTVYVTYTFGGIKGYARVDGLWKPIKNGFIRVNDEWKEIKYGDIIRKLS